MPNNAEEERLKRLRDQQLAARNPRTKGENFSRKMVQRNRKLERQITVGSVWNSIPHKWRSAGGGLLLGLILIFLVPQYWISDWALPAMIGVTVLLIMLGVVIGNALDVRDELRDLSR
jgi:hypothetical protein